MIQGNGVKNLNCDHDARYRKGPDFRVVRKRWAGIDTWYQVFLDCFLNTDQSWQAGFMGYDSSIVSILWGCLYVVSCLLSCISLVLFSVFKARFLSIALTS